MSWIGCSTTPTNNNVFLPHVGIDIYQQCSNVEFVKILVMIMIVKMMFILAMMTPMMTMKVRMLGFQKKILLILKMRLLIPLIKNDMVCNISSLHNFKLIN